MVSSVLEWKDATKQLPEASDYNKDGCVIVAYEDGNVGKGYFMITGEWAFKNLHGDAMFWASYPEHPKKEDTFKTISV